MNATKKTKPKHLELGMDIGGGGNRSTIHHRPSSQFLGKKHEQSFHSDDIDESHQLSLPLVQVCPSIGVQQLVQQVVPHRNIEAPGREINKLCKLD